MSAPPSSSLPDALLELRLRLPPRVPPRPLPRGRPPREPRPRPRPRVLAGVVVPGSFSMRRPELLLSLVGVSLFGSPVLCTLIVPRAAGLARLLARAPRPRRELVGREVFVEGVERLRL